MADTNRAIKALRDELALQTRHCKLLEAQEQALLACDHEQFAVLQAQHAQMLPQLEAQDGACRVALTDEEGRSLTLAALQSAAPASSRPILAGLGDGLRGTLGRVQALTQRNRTLIQNELDYFAFTLDLLVEAGRTADLGYGPNGLNKGRRLTNRLFLDRRA